MLADEPWLVPQLRAYGSENAKLVKDIGTQAATRVERLVHDAVRTGSSLAQLQASIRDAMGTTERRAALIARDQVGKLNGVLTRLRHEGAGITEYRWRGALDRREREAHRAREGKLFAYASPPADGNPGQPIQCRCYAEPVLSEFDDLLAMAKTHGPKSNGPSLQYSAPDEKGPAYEPSLPKKIAEKKAEEAKATEASKLQELADLVVEANMARAAANEAATEAALAKLAAKKAEEVAAAAKAKAWAELKDEATQSLFDRAALAGAQKEAALDAWLVAQAEAKAAAKVAEAQAAAATKQAALKSVTYDQYLAMGEDEAIQHIIDLGPDGLEFYKGAYAHKKALTVKTITPEQYLTMTPEQQLQHIKELGSDGPAFWMQANEAEKAIKLAAQQAAEKGAMARKGELEALAKPGLAAAKALQPYAGAPDGEVHNPVPAWHDVSKEKHQDLYGEWYGASNDDLAEVLMLDPKLLKTMQPTVTQSKVVGLVSDGYDPSKGKPLKVILVDGEYVLLDGNHRAAAALLSGVDKVEVKLAVAKDELAAQFPTLFPDQLEALKDLKAMSPLKKVDKWFDLLETDDAIGQGKFLAAFKHLTPEEQTAFKAELYTKHKAQFEEAYAKAHGLEDDLATFVVRSEEHTSELQSH